MKRLSNDSILEEVAAIQSQSGFAAPTFRELNPESHPSIKIKIEEENKSETKKKPRGRPKTHGLSGTPTYRSFHEAKQRCENPKNPDYPTYGGRGIQFRLQSLQELVNEIGERPAGKTLDRINSNKHYEAGNLRWASATEQANNRRPPSTYRHCSGDWYRSSEDRARYLQTARHWSLSIASINVPDGLVEEDISFLEDRHAETGLPHATFWEPHVQKEGHYIILPSLNDVGARTVMRVANGLQMPNDRGLLVGAMDIPLKLNCAEEELSLINSFVRGIQTRSGQTGLVYSGCSASFSNNRIEGRMLVTASRFCTLRIRSRVVLSAKLAELLSIGETEPLLRNEYLFLPDLEVWARVFGADRLLTRSLYKLLCDRESSGFPTVAYVESPAVIGEEFTSLFACRFQTANLAKVMPVPIP